MVALHESWRLSIRKERLLTASRGHPVPGMAPRSVVVVRIPDRDIIDRHLDGVRSSLPDVSAHHRKMIHAYFNYARRLQQDDDFVSAAIDQWRSDSGATGEKKGDMSVAKSKSDYQKPLDLAEVENNNQIILPKGMGIPAAIMALTKKQAELEAEVQIIEQVEAYPLDGAVAFSKALAKIYGWATPVPTPSFFGDKPPALVDVEIGIDDNGNVIHGKVVWGRFVVPGIEGYLQTSADFNGKEPKFIIAAVIKAKHKAKVTALANETRTIAREQSIYRGKALRLSITDEGGVDHNTGPKFLDVTRVRESQIIFPERIAEQVKTNVFTPLKHTAMARKYTGALKRGILLAGEYGVGKTLLAYVTARVAQDNGWTFLYLERVSGLADAVLFARRYSPCVIFAEDIDRILGGERDMSVDDVLNIVDGIDSKSQELMIILTTNFVDKIEKAMIRPGRLDAVINLPRPDAPTVERLIRMYAGDLLDPGEDLTEAGKELANQIPSTIAEAVKRSKFYAISHLDWADDDLYLTGQDVAAAARGMADHVKLLTAKDDQEHPHTTLGRNMAETVRREVEHVMTNGIVEKIAERVAELQ
jgi:transitional endoplasmic reticulum ATPase